MKIAADTRRFLKHWRLARSYGSSRRQAFRLALAAARRGRDFGPSNADWAEAYRTKNEGRFDA